MKTYVIENEEGLEEVYAQFFGELAKLHEAPKRCVLVVDDEPTIRRMVSRSMKTVDKALTVHEAENGQDALEVLKGLRDAGEDDPVLIVTDLQMPVMDGWELIEALRKDYESQGRSSGIPLVVLSSSSGVKGILARKSVHGEKSKYTPIATVAKENCIKPFAYDMVGTDGLMSWVQYFLTDQE